MGFFRFRRSVKLFPGVRWNIGMRSSSISLGGRGAHYTFGSYGSRFTVGIPGTGLSYTDIHRSHTHVAERHTGVPVPSESWIRNNQIKTTLHTPERKPGEPPVRQEQLDTIRNLLPSFDFDQIKDFGESQADELIAQIKVGQREASKTLMKRFYAEHGHAIPDDFIDHCYDHPGKPWKPKNHVARGFLAFLVLLVLISLFRSPAKRESVAAPAEPSPRPSTVAFGVASSVANAIPLAAKGNGLPAPRYWPKRVRIARDVELRGEVDGGTIAQTAKAGTLLDATLSVDHRSVIVRRLDITGTVPIGETDFLERARKAGQENGH